ncbi:hypothetical protein KFV09_13285 [Anoxybacillus rupiensis]|uniref:hypothetical protein n=1 Tax=Anoxybacteroides rupiense TaxID=311460 RepID=UPI0017F5D391|nr:hypothetical protein [Anoxybacillus rupiensis]MBB3909000.1 hypothetical protein [Anoxybacillus rupiensis]MBS2772503.1 hypothetical protein [Anoxybacillus rupiensis]
MRSKYASVQDKIIQSKINYFKYFHFFFQFIIHYFFTISCRTSSRQKQIYTERVILNSLELIEKIHMYLYEQQFFFQEIGMLSEKLSFFSKNNESYHDLKCLMSLIQQHPFFKQEHKQLFEKVIRRILSYYYSPDVQNIKVVVDASLSSPWKPKH